MIEVSSDDPFKEFHIMFLKLLSMRSTYIEKRRHILDGHFDGKLGCLLQL